MSIKDLYTKEIIPAMKEKFGITNIMAVPKITKVVVNVGVGKMVKEANFIDNVENTVTRITGQKPVRTKAKKSIASFKIRQGVVVGVTATVRGKRMYDFIEKLIGVTLPRIRDFRGISTKLVDRQGNMTIGFKEHLPFPEIKPEEIERIHGLEVSITTNAKDHDKGLELFKLMGFPFKS